jgi:CheY-like chemotaxis protein
MAGSRRTTTALAGSASNSRQTLFHTITDECLCQVGSQATLERCRFVARVLLLDSDASDAHELAVYLEGQHFSVTVCRDSKDAVDVLKGDRNNFEVLVLDISRDRCEDWETLDSLRRVIKPGIPGPGILCLAGPDNGPHVVLKAERKGARCVIRR